MNLKNSGQERHLASALLWLSLKNVSLSNTTFMLGIRKLSSLIYKKISFLKYIFLVIIILFISGCTQLEKSVSSLDIGATSIVSLVENPTNYYGKDVVVIAHPSTRFLPRGIDKEFTYYIHENDEEGKPIRMSVKYGKFYCSKCKIIGTVERVEICECEYSYCDGNNCELSENAEWNPKLELGTQVTISKKECEKKTIRKIEYRVGKYINRQ